jgi:hypothetical protein
MYYKIYRWKKQEKSLVPLEEVSELMFTTTRGKTEIRREKSVTPSKTMNQLGPSKNKRQGTGVALSIRRFSVVFGGFQGKVGWSSWVSGRRETQ